LLSTALLMAEFFFIGWTSSDQVWPFFLPVPSEKTAGSGQTGFNQPKRTWPILHYQLLCYLQCCILHCPLLYGISYS